jgi:hypothetical protein
MNTQNNTGLGLIKITIERVQNEKSLFNSALKKLVNSTEEELDDFLKRKITPKVAEGLLRLISGGQKLILKALNGSRLICSAEKTFKSFIDNNFVNWGINKPGIVTPKKSVQVHEMVGNGTSMDIFKSLPGSWNQKWLSQDQIIEFCETLPNWLRQEGYGTFALIKKDENKPIDENNPGDNLVVVRVYVSSDGLDVRVSRLETDLVWRGEVRRRVVSQQLISSVA